MAGRADKKLRGIRSSTRTRTLLGRLSPHDGDVEMLSLDEVLADFLGQDLIDLINSLIDNSGAGAMLPLVNGEIYEPVLADAGSGGGTAQFLIPGAIIDGDGQFIGVSI